MSTHLVIPDPHAKPGVPNTRALWVGELIADVKPDVVIMIGDLHEFDSLCSYDRGKGRFQGRNYRADVDAGIDFNDRMWSRVKARKKRLPLRIAHEGNHEERIRRALDVQPELDGAIGIKDLMWEDYYDECVWYDGGSPGINVVDGIHYAHYMVSGVMGRPIGGEHPAYSLLTKRYASCTVGHLHLFDHCIRTRVDGSKMQGLVAGCFFDHFQAWAGQANALYWPGVFIKRNVENGNYDLEMVSLEQLRKTYGHLT